MKQLPHPSITGMASLAVLGSFLNSKSGWAAWGGVKPSGKDSVTGWLMRGNIEKAAKRLVENTRSTVLTTGGRKAVATSILVATGGALIRKHIPRVKIGTAKTYLTI